MKDAAEIAYIPKYSDKLFGISRCCREKKIDNETYEIKTRGTLFTSFERLRKLGITHAAKVGLENNRKFFKISSIKVKWLCSARRHKEATYTPAPGSYLIENEMFILAKYSNKKHGDKFLESAKAFKKYKKELDVLPTQDQKMQVYNFKQQKCASIAAKDQK